VSSNALYERAEDPSAIFASAIQNVSALIGPTPLFLRSQTALEDVGNASRSVADFANFVNAQLRTGRNSEEIGGHLSSLYGSMFFSVLLDLDSMRHVGFHQMNRTLLENIAVSQ